MVTEGRIRQKKLENQLKLEAKLHDLEVCLAVPHMAVDGITLSAFYLFL